MTNASAALGPAFVRNFRRRYADAQAHGATPEHRAALVVQGVVAVLLLAGLALHVAEVGLVGLMVIVLATAFLFLLTSAAAPLVRLSYGRMCWMALPYLVTTTTTGLVAILFM